jgi:hypothetical protein
MNPALTPTKEVEKAQYYCHDCGTSARPGGQRDSLVVPAELAARLAADLEALQNDTAAIQAERQEARLLRAELIKAQDQLQAAAGYLKLANSLAEAITEALRDLDSVKEVVRKQYPDSAATTCTAAGLVDQAMLFKNNKLAQLQDQLQAEKIAQELMALRLTSQERVDNSPAQAHILDWLEYEIVHERRQMCAENKNLKEDRAWLVDWLIYQAENSHGCFTGDCPHLNQADCVNELLKQYDQRQHD